MMYEGKEVWTQENFSYQDVKIGDYVEQAVVDDAMDCLPPACMTSRCSQMGEPYSHREDPETGEFRATYATFKRVAASGRTAFGSIAVTVSVARTWSGARTRFTTEGGERNVRDPWEVPWGALGDH